MTDRPIIFSGPMIKAILDGRKTVMRRIIKPQPNSGPNGEMVHLGDGSWGLSDGVLTGEWKLTRPGDRLWVREAHKLIDRHCDYRADWPEGRRHLFRWRPSIHMPRWASRITLEVTEVRVQRLQDISEEDARAEGVATDGAKFWINEMRPETVTNYSARETVSYLWNAIHGPGSWDANPFVAALTFKLANKEPAP